MVLTAISILTEGTWRGGLANPISGLPTLASNSQVFSSTSAPQSRRPPGGNHNNLARPVGGLYVTKLRLRSRVSGIPSRRATGSLVATTHSEPTDCPNSTVKFWSDQYLAEYLGGVTPGIGRP